MTNMGEVNNMKKLLVVSLIITTIVIMSGIPTSAANYLYGWWGTFATTTKWEVTNGSTASKIVQYAEGCVDSSALGSKVKRHQRVAASSESSNAVYCTYFNVKSTYGYCKEGGYAEDTNYRVYQRYVY